MAQTSKVVQVAAHTYSGGTRQALTDASWKTLPGASGDFNREALEIEDSILGQEYRSQEVGLISWSVTGMAIYKGFAGYCASLRVQSGAATTESGGALTRVGSTLVWELPRADMAHRVIDAGTPVVVYEDGTAVPSGFTVDRLLGHVTFDAAPTGAVTMDYMYKNLTTLGRGMSFTLNMSAEAVENTDFQTAKALAGNVQGANVAGFRTYQIGLKSVGLDVSGIFDTATDFAEILNERTVSVIEISPEGLDTSVTGDPAKGSFARGYFYLVNQSQSGDVGALEEESLTFSLSVPSSDYSPFSWYHSADTRLDDATQICLNAFTAESNSNASVIAIRYLYNGADGWSGDAIITEMSLEGGLDVMNEFSITFQGSGPHTEVGTVGS